MLSANPPACQLVAGLDDKRLANLETKRAAVPGCPRPLISHLVVFMPAFAALESMLASMTVIVIVIELEAEKRRDAESIVIIVIAGAAVTVPTETPAPAFAAVPAMDLLH
jgi:hypothetical protein